MQGGVEKGPERGSESKSGDPKPFTHRVFVDPSKSIESLCREAGIEIDQRLLDGQGRLKRLGEWPEKQKPNGIQTPYIVTLTSALTDNKGEQKTTAGMLWEKVIKGKAEHQRLSTVIEILELIKYSPALLDGQRLVASKTVYDSFDLIVFERREGKTTMKTIFVGDTNTDSEIFDPQKEKEKGEGYSVNGAIIKEGKVATNLPFAVILVSDRLPQIPNA